VKSAETLTVRTLNRATLARQMLLARQSVTPLAAIERLVGLQAQWPKPPFIGLWTRLPKFRREDLCGLLQTRRAVRGTMMRGTIFVTSTRDYVRFRAALQPLLTRGLQSVLRKRLDGFDVDAVVRTARGIFEEQPRTFDQVRDLLVSRYPTADERAMGYAARMLLPLIQVPTNAQWGFPAVAQFGLAETWLDQPLARDQGPRALVLRYLAALGPASVADAQTWSGFQGLKEVFESLRPKLRAFRDERGRELFDLPRAPRPAEDTPAPVRFLPDFDNLILGHDDRRRAIADRHRPAVFLSALRVTQTFLIDGFVAGTWKIDRKKSKATLSIAPFGTVPNEARAALVEEGEKLVRFAEPDGETFDVRVGKNGARRG